MILPDFVLPSRVNQRWSYSGIDNLEYCVDKKHFKTYPHEITYNYNSRGYRDAEWPDQLEELKNAIWCVGDSFTVGIGSPYNHIWPQCLQQVLNQRTINVSMDGASNNWMARKSQRILKEIQPNYLIIHWSYIHRRERSINLILDQKWDQFYKKIQGPGWPSCTRQNRSTLPEDILKKINTWPSDWWTDDYVFDDQRICHHTSSSVEEDIENTLNCIKMVQNFAGSTVIIHSFIPACVPYQTSNVLESQIQGLVIPEIKVLDLARDGHHYDIATSRCFVEKLINLLK